MQSLHLAAMQVRLLPLTCASRTSKPCLLFAVLPLLPLLQVCAC
jgi:hypothetical protein